MSTVFETNAENMVDIDRIRKVSAEYIVGRLRLGYKDIAKFVACSLFEALIDTKYENLLHEGRAHQPADPKHDTLQHRIDQLDAESLRDSCLNRYRNLFTYYVINTGIKEEYYRRSEPKRLRQIKTRLHNFRNLRNAIIHGHEETYPFPEDIYEFIAYLWAEFANDSFEKNLQPFKDASTISCEEMVKSIREIPADYMVRAIDDNIQVHDGEEPYSGLLSNDFEDMFTLRRKMARLQNDLKNWFQINEPQLKTDILTTIDTTSAYIWMPFVSSHFNDSMPVGIFNCCVSILATPKDFRVYMDFGGYADKERFAYYQFLESKDYYDFMETFKGKEQMEVFDVDWFSFIANNSMLESHCAVIIQKIVSAKRKLSDSKLPITWNRMLHGYILKIDNVPKNGITLEWTTERLGWIVQFYKKFKEFKPSMTLEDYKKKRIPKK